MSFIRSHAVFRLSVIACALASLPARARAQRDPEHPARVVATSETERAEARRLGSEGMRAFDRGEYRLAEERLRRAFSLFPVPTLALYWARTLEKLGLLLEAEQAYEQAIDVSSDLAHDTVESASDREQNDALQREARESARRERAQLIARIPSVSIQVQSAPDTDVAVTLNGAPLSDRTLVNPVRLNPGIHRIVATSGELQVVRELQLRERQAETVVLRLPSPEAAPANAKESTKPALDHAVVPPDAAPSPSAQRIGGWAAVAVGGAAALFGGVMGVRALSQRSELDGNGCNSGRCYDDQREAVESYNTSRTLCTLGFGLGALGLGLGTVLLWTLPTHEPRHSNRSLAVQVGIDGVTATGRF